MSQLVLSPSDHDKIVEAAFCRRGFMASEAADGARICQMASWHGIRSHNALKALHLDETLGSGHHPQPGCIPAAQIEKLPAASGPTQRWIAHQKFGPAVAFEAITACEAMADKFGIGIVSVDQAFHYLWGGGYVMESARRGYVAYTCCTSGLAEVIPFRGRSPTIGTNPHSWGFPTTKAIGFPIVVDWATSTIAYGKVQQAKRDGSSLPPDSAIDAQGHPTQDPDQVAALVPFGGKVGGHKGYGLGLIIELLGALIGGSLSTLRSRPENAAEGEKTTPTFYFQVVHPEALSCGAFAQGRNQTQNVLAVIENVLGHGNEECLLPGQIEHEAAKRSEQAGGLLFTEVEIEQFKKIADDEGVAFDPTTLNRFPSPGVTEK